MVIPHPTIPVGHVRPADIVLMLVIGAVHEIVTRLLARLVRSKSKEEVAMDDELQCLQFETANKRRLGPDAFVETSKLERICLKKERAIEKRTEERQKRTEVSDKRIKYFGLGLYFLVFVVYYGIPMLTIDGMRIESDNLDFNNAANSAERAKGFMKRILFPVSVVGMGFKIARLGIPNAKSSIGALVVLWSSQVTIGKIIDCAEVLLS